MERWSVELRALKFTGLPAGLRVCEKIRSWFDALTTNGMV